MPRIPPELGKPVSSREFSYGDIAERAWGSEFRAPDHGIYEFRGGRFDSTDRNRTGIYGVVGDNSMIVDGARYPDMRDAINRDFGPGQPNGSLNLPFGSFDEFVPDTELLPYPFEDPLAEYDTYFDYVVSLIHDTILDSSKYATPFIQNPGGQVSVEASSRATFLGSTQAILVPSVNGGTICYNALNSIFSQPLVNMPMTIEFAIMILTTPPSDRIILGVGPGSNDQYMYLNSNRRISASWSGFTINLASPALDLNRWYQCAMTYDGGPGPGVTGNGTVRFFVDGVMTGTIAGTMSTRPDQRFGPFELPSTGATGSNIASVHCLRKEQRYTLGIQRYGNGGYVPRTTPFPNSAPPVVV